MGNRNMLMDDKKQADSNEVVAYDVNKKPVSSNETLIVVNKKPREVSREVLFLTRKKAAQSSETLFLLNQRPCALKELISKTCAGPKQMKKKMGCSSGNLFSLGHKHWTNTFFLREKQPIRSKIMEGRMIL